VAGAAAVRVGAVDIGTNTVRLLVAERHGGGLFPDRLDDLDRRVVITTLGQGVDRTGRFADDVVARTVEVLAAYGAAIRAWDVAVVDAVATSATRDAENRDTFLDRAELALGFRPRVISGEEEAALSFAGTRAGVPGDGSLLVLDPGGGSTEFVFGRSDVEFAASIDIGSVRLTERMLPAHPATPEQVTGASVHVDGLLADVDLPAPPDVVVGVGGTFTSLAAIALDLEEYDRRVVDGSTHRRDTFVALVDRLAAMSLPDIAAIPSLDPARAPVLLGGAIVVERSLHAVGAAEVTVSEADILDGLALRADRPSPVS
jgi:exopolyphosphatase/guanosine-5'-triphosphate,3'-diphosphate pyrophosphatase